ncbi:MAG: serine/threonine-protein kinase [Cystobacter sp.]
MSTSGKRGAMYLEPGTRVDRWRVVEPLGVGGQGAAYLVEHLEHPGELYVLKLALHAHDRRAEREVALMMDPAVHPNVVRFHACARWPHPREGCLGFIMDWVPGKSLDAWAETGGTTFRQLADVAATVASTLGDLHARGVLHRDLKPEHIRLRESDGQPVLLDFGGGWYEGAVPITPGPLPPTSLHVLSPEAVRHLWSRPLDHPKRYSYQPTDDLYALGVCLYRAVTGRYPFTEWLPTDTLQYAIVHRRPLTPVQLNPQTPRALSALIMRLLAKTPQARYPSGAAVHEALVAALLTSGAWNQPIVEEEQPLPAPRGPSSRRQPHRSPRTATTAEAPGPGRWRMGVGVALLALLFMTFVWTAPQLRGGDWTNGHDPQQAPASAPDKNQKRAPCTPKLEVEYFGACWFPHQQRPPNCPPQTVAHDGRCLLPVPQPRTAIPTSVDESHEVRGSRETPLIPSREMKQALFRTHGE